MAIKYKSTCMKQGELFESVNVEAPIEIDVATQQRLLEYDNYARTRLSKNFILRDFLYSTRAEVLGVSNAPENPEAVIKAGKALCEKVCEPLLEKFGRFAITYGYQSRRLIEAGYKKPSSPKSSAPHQWDRGTFGNKVYARIDILPFCVEDGEVSKLDYGRWIMANLDIDLLMTWHHSNVFCITIGPKPRRVFLEWVPYGTGDDGSNKVVYMGEYYWQVVWPTLPEDKRPKFGPSCTGGKMYWG